MHGVLVQLQALCQRIAGAPDALPAKGEMQPAVAPVGQAGARLHRVGDHAVVDNARAHDMGGPFDHAARLLKIALGPVERHVFGRSVVQSLTARRKIDLHRQLVDIRENGFSSVARIGQRVGHDDRQRIADEAHAVPRENAPLGACARGPVHPGVQHRLLQGEVDAHLVKLGRTKRQRDTRHRARILQIERIQHPMPHVRAQDHRVQRILGCNISDVTPGPGQESLVFQTLHRLGFAELFHAHTPPVCCRNPSG